MNHLKLYIGLFALITILPNPAQSQTLPEIENLAQEIGKTAEKLNSMELPQATQPDTSYDFWNSLSQPEIERVKRFDAWLIKRLTKVSSLLPLVKTEIAGTLGVIKALEQEKPNYQKSGALKVWEAQIAQKRNHLKDYVLDRLKNIFEELFISCGLNEYYSSCKDGFTWSFYGTTVGDHLPYSNTKIKITAGAIYLDLIQEHAKQYAKIFDFIREQTLEIPGLEPIELERIFSKKISNFKSRLKTQQWDIDRKDEYLRYAHIEFLKHGYLDGTQ